MERTEMFIARGVFRRLLSTHALELRSIAQRVHSRLPWFNGETFGELWTLDCDEAEFLYTLIETATIALETQVSYLDEMVSHGREQYRKDLFRSRRELLAHLIADAR